MFYEAFIGRGNAYAEFLTEQGNDRARFAAMTLINVYPHN